MSSPPDAAMSIEEIRKVVPAYETDPSIVGTNRAAVDPEGDRPWYEVHGLTREQAHMLVEEYG